MNKKIIKTAIIIVFIIIIILGIFYNFETQNKTESIENNTQISYEISNIPKYNNKAYVEINNNLPQFTNMDMNIQEDYYSVLENGRVRNGNDKN